MAETTETADWKSGWTRPEVSALRDRHRPQRRAGWWPPPVPCLCLQNDLPGCQLLGDGCAPARDLLSDDSRFACLTCHVSGDPQPSLLMGTDQSRIRTEGNDGRTGRNKSSDVQDTRPALHLAARRPLSRGNLGRGECRGTPPRQTAPSGPPLLISLVELTSSSRAQWTDTPSWSLSLANPRPPIDVAPNFLLAPSRTHSTLPIPIAAPTTDDAPATEHHDAIVRAAQDPSKGANYASCPRIGCSQPFFAPDASLFFLAPPLSADVSLLFIGATAKRRRHGGFCNIRLPGERRIPQRKPHLGATSAPARCWCDRRSR